MLLPLAPSHSVEGTVSFGSTVRTIPAILPTKRLASLVTSQLLLSMCCLLYLYSFFVGIFSMSCNHRRVQDFPIRGCEPQERALTYYWAIFFSKIPWKWKEVEKKEGRKFLAPPLWIRKWQPLNANTGQILSGFGRKWICEKLSRENVALADWKWPTTPLVLTIAHYFFRINKDHEPLTEFKSVC